MSTKVLKKIVNICEVVIPTRRRASNQAASKTRDCFCEE